MRPTPELMASCLAALMQNPDTRAWVAERAGQPGKGGEIGIWTQLAYEYAESLMHAAGLNTFSYDSR